MHSRLTLSFQQDPVPSTDVPFLLTGESTPMPDGTCKGGHARMLPHARPLILVLDDSPTVRKLVEVPLRREGYQVVSYAAPLQALIDLLRGPLSPPDVIFVDLVLPQVSGWAVIRALRSRVQFRHTAIIVLTRLSGALPSLYARLLGADAYLTKPFTSQQLVDLVRHYSPTKG
jgi:twitching motility two-component system response regulator PilG